MLTSNLRQFWKIVGIGKKPILPITDFRGAFTSLPLGLIVKTIDILPICLILRNMWKETALGNQVRLIVNGQASETITITRGVAQGNTISPLTFAVVKETIAK